MNYWILSANKKYYDYHKAFNELVFVDWKDGNRNFNIGDIVYIYSTKPIARIEYKCEVIASKIKDNETINDSIYWTHNSKFNNVNNTYIRLKKIKQFNTELLSLKNLINNGLKSAPLSPIILVSELLKYINRIENSLINNSIYVENKKFLLVDHGSGSYNIENKGLELFNESANPLDEKYYAYVPPHNTLDITKLGASKNDNSVEGIVVIFVTKTDEHSTDRIITGLYPNAKIYSKPISGKKLQRVFVDKSGSVKYASYSIESDSYLPLKHLSLIINTKKYNSYLFRGQRVYSGTNIELDKKIYSFLVYIFNEINEKDDINYQTAIADSVYANEQDIINAPIRKVEIITTINGRRVKRDPSLAKTAIAKSNYSCEVNPEHTTFLNSSNEQYMEGHHLIPLTLDNALFFEKNFNINIDCIENIVSVCPNCHKAIHLGNKDTKKRILDILFIQRKQQFENLGIVISLDELSKFYNI